MKRVFLYAASLAMIFSLAACGNQNNKKASKDATAETKAPATPEYKLMDKPQVDLSEFPQDKDGYYVIFEVEDSQAVWTYVDVEHANMDSYAITGCKAKGTEIEEGAEVITSNNQNLADGTRVIVRNREP